jgi:dihydrofolate reductase
LAKLIYSALTSLDGYVADEDGNFDWAEPDEEVHTVVNDLERQVGTYLYGRRMYEVLVAWETLDLADQPPFIRDYAGIWRAADKIVYSTTLQTVSRRQDPGRASVRPGSRPADEGVGGT